MMIPQVILITICMVLSTLYIRFVGTMGSNIEPMPLQDSCSAGIELGCCDWVCSKLLLEGSIKLCFDYMTFWKMAQSRILFPDWMTF